MNGKACSCNSITADACTGCIHICLIAGVKNMIKKTVEECNSIDVRRLHLKPGRDCFEQIPLVWTPCNFGSYRPWFLCPNCGRRVLILYSKNGSPYSCRTCQNLTFKSSQLSKRGRLLLKRKKLAVRLGIDDGTYPCPDSRPKRMKRNTFGQLSKKYLAVQKQIDNLANRRKRQNVICKFVFDIT